MISKEECIKSASKCKSITEWKNNYSDEYIASLKNAWYFDCIKHIKK